MTAPTALAGRKGLLDLADGNGIDMCASLLRTLTDLYLQRPLHTPEDEHYYTELALRLIDAAEVSERAALAARLASYPSAPMPVLERLARDVIEVAGPILKHSHLKSAAEAPGGALSQMAASSPSSASPAVRPCGPGDAVEPSELADLFYHAGAAERRLILINLEYALFLPSRPLSAVRGTDVWRLEAAALLHEPEALIRELGKLLGISQMQASRIVNDELGEPMVVAAKAIDLSSGLLQRLLLFLSRCVGQRFDRMHELAQLYREVTADAAWRLVTIWRDAEQGESGRVQHELAAWRIAAENARRALCELSRRPELRSP
jgi:hypothetical protein